MLLFSQNRYQIHCFDLETCYSIAAFGILHVMQPFQKVISCSSECIHIYRLVPVSD